MAYALMEDMKPVVMQVIVPMTTVRNRHDFVGSSPFHDVGFRYAVMLWFSPTCLV
jgi:hypothetical protein